MNSTIVCKQCAHLIPEDANFCAACGQPVAAPFAAASVPVYRASLARPRQPRLLAGVCAGIAEHYGWDLSLVRVVVAVFTCLTSGLGILIYLAAWVIIPEAPFVLPAATEQRTAL
jgi:phage shock protein C